MTSTLTPPSASAPQSAPPSGPSTAARVISILAIVLGAVIVLGTALSAVGSTAAAALVRTETRAVDAAGAESLDIDLSAGSLTVVFDDRIEQGTLQVTSSTGVQGWTVRRSGGTLRIASPEHRVGLDWMFGGAGRAVLRLPSDHMTVPLDARFTVSAGALRTSGDFGMLKLDVGAGSATVSGSARSLAVDLSAGAADLTLSTVQTADLTVSAGALDTRLTGVQPQTVRADVSAGALDLTVPKGEYHVSSEVSAGRFDNHVESLPGAYGSITVQVSAGQATLRER